MIKHQITLLPDLQRNKNDIMLKFGEECMDLNGLSDKLMYLSNDDTQIISSVDNN